MLQNAQQVRLVINSEQGSIVAEGEVMVVGDRHVQIKLREGVTAKGCVVGTPGILEFVGDGGVELGNTSVLEFDPEVDGLLSVKRPIQFKLENRRRLFRLRISGKVPFDVLKTNAPELKDRKNLEGAFRDISGGGMCFASKVPVNVGDVVRTRLDFGKYFSKIDYPSELNAKVLRCIPTPGVPDWPWSVGVEFMGLLEKHRSSLIRLVFEMERGKTKS